MRRPVFAGVLVTFVVSLGACTALLGDFSVDGARGPGADGGGGDGAAVEAGVDAAADGQALPVQKCVVNGSPVSLLDAPRPAASERLGIHAFKLRGNDTRRIMWTEGGSNLVNFVTIDDRLSPASIVRQSADLRASPQGVASYDGGFAAVGLSQTGGTHLVALRFDDGTETPTDSVDITGLGILPPSVSDLSVAVAPVGGDDFFVVFTYSTGVGVWSMYAGRVRIALGAGPGGFKLVSSTVNARPSLDSDALVIDKPGGRAVLFLKADQGKGATTLVPLDLANGAPIGVPQPLPPLHGTSTYEPLAAQTSLPGVADKVGVALLEYDLNNASAPFYVYAGVFPALGFSGFKVGSLPPPVSFTSPAEVAVDKGRSFWTHYPSGSHVVEAARGTQTGKGVNFLWLDGAGNLRGKASGADALVSGEAVKGAAGTMLGAPTVVIANAAITWLTDTGALRIANVGCAK